MEDNKQLVELLEQINEANRRQARWLRLQCLFTLITAVCFAGILYLVWNFLPQISSVLTQLEAVMAQLPDMVEQMSVVLENLEVVTTELTAVDFSATVDGINDMVAMGQSSLKETVEKLNTIDFNTLNLAIQNLSEVITPLANFVSKFR